MKVLGELEKRLVYQQFGDDKNMPPMTYDNYYLRVKNTIKYFRGDLEKNPYKAIEKWLGIKLEEWR